MNTTKSSRQLQVANLKAGGKMLQSFFQQLMIFLRDRRQMRRFLMLVTISILAFAGWMVWKTVQLHSDLQTQYTSLANLSYYDTTNLFMQIPEEQQNIKTIEQLIAYNQDIQQQIKNFSDYTQALQVSYDYLLKDIYLPSLNIWKDSYYNTIDASIIGTKFIERNPFDNIKLIQERSNFFKSIADGNQVTQVTNVSIGDIKQNNDSAYYSIPVTVSFRAPTKRAFLMLVDKISITSYPESIGLVNEFFYYLRDVIKEQKALQIQNIPFAEESVDKAIAYDIYQRITSDYQTVVIDTNTIEQTIQRVAQCDNKSTENCLYSFREKYRNIAHLAYGISQSQDPVEELRTFLQNLPPIILIQDFSFTKQIIGINQQTSYQGTVVFEVYGRAMTSEDRVQIEDYLGSQCFGSKREFTPNIVQQELQKFLGDISKLRSVDQSQSNQLLQVQQNIQNIITDYDKYNNYTKSIRLFEIYRMVQNIGLCSNT